LENSTKDYKHGWVIKGGQKYFTTYNEKGTRDKNFKTEVSKTSFKVGPQNVRKEDAPAVARAKSRRPSAWFLDETREIPSNQSWFG